MNCTMYMLCFIIIMFIIIIYNSKTLNQPEGLRNYLLFLFPAFFSCLYSYNILKLITCVFDCPPSPSPSGKQGTLNTPTFQCIVDTEAVFARVLANLIKVLSDEFLLLDELDVGQTLGRELDGLVEPVLPAVGDIDQLNDLGLQPLVKHVGLRQFSL